MSHFLVRHDYDVNPPNEAFYGGLAGRTWTYDNEFSFLFLKLDRLLKNSSPEEIASIWQIERVQLFSHPQITFKLTEAGSILVNCMSFAPYTAKTSISILQTLFAEQTEIGKLYELVVTTLSGLYRYRIGDVVKIARFHNNCPVVEYQYRQGQILNVRAEKTSERIFYDALKSVLNQEGQRFRLVDYTCAESIMLDDESRALKTADVKGTAPFYVVFLELSSGKLEEEEMKTLENKVCKLR